MTRGMEISSLSLRECGEMKIRMQRYTCSKLAVACNERPDLNHFRLDNMNKVSEEYIYFLGLESAFLYLFHTFRHCYILSNVLV